MRVTSFMQELHAPSEAAAVGPDVEAAAAGDYHALLRILQRVRHPEGSHFEVMGR